MIELAERRTPVTIDPLLKPARRSTLRVGLLGLGRKEAISDAEVLARYEALDPAEKLFRRKR